MITKDEFEDAVVFKEEDSYNETVCVTASIAVGSSILASRQVWKDDEGKKVVKKELIEMLLRHIYDYDQAALRLAIQNLITCPSWDFEESSKIRNEVIAAARLRMPL